MTLTKHHIIEQIVERVGFSSKQSTELVETLLEIIKRTMASGDDVLVSNFGKFNVSEKAERKGRNPATGEAMMLPARKVVTFKPSATLREKINKTPDHRKKK
jgi:integration host factor subunit alpha